MGLKIFNLEGRLQRDIFFATRFTNVLGENGYNVVYWHDGIPKFLYGRSEYFFTNQPHFPVVYL